MNQQSLAHVGIASDENPVQATGLELMGKGCSTRSLRRRCNRFARGPESVAGSRTLHW